ncbi:SusC/RagA family TonB-linked outer membrane protein, partial [Daejeonella sp.]|uniref:SusC/RagA family TonB-linked outer membrane protein n=1 Tax=Daejeonella sp. TaxID=2805397 RepID=UPI0030C306E7
GHYTSLQTTANRIEILTGQEYLDYVNESAQFVPGPSGFGQTDTSLPLAYTGDIETTDWIDLISQNGLVNNTDLSIGGNSDNSNYYVSFNHFDQKGIVRASGLRKGGIRANLDMKVTDKLRSGIRLNAAQYKTENNKVAYSGIVNTVVPIRKVYDANGKFTGQNPISSTIQRNPEADIQLRTDHDLVTKLTTNAYLEYEIISNLKFKTTLGADLTYNKQNDYLPGILPEITTGGFGRIATNNQKSILNENTFNYNFSTGKHAFKMLGGFTFQKDNNESTFAESDGFSNDAVTFNNLALGDAATAKVGSGYGQRALVSYLSRIDYNFNSKYLLTLVGRYDGSSVFETGNKYSFFPSAGLAWNADQEEFMKNIDWVSSLKVRGSLGKVGEQGVAAYNSIATYDNTLTTFNENLANGILVGAVPSNGLTWETTTQLDLGVEVGLLRDRISFEVDYYNKRTSDLLLRVALSGQVGANSTTQLQNLGSVRNRGLEFSFNSQNIDRKNFSWRSSLILSANRSNILALAGQPFINLQSTGNQGGNSARLIVGQPLPVFVGAKYLGTYKSKEEIIADKQIGVFLGSPRFEDLNKDGVINNQDAQIIGSPQPDFYGGLRNSFKYKRLALDVFVHGQYGSEIFNIISQGSFFGRGDQNVSPIVVDRWKQGVNETSDIPRAGTSSGIYNSNSTVNIEDGSFLRLKSVSLSYDFPIEKTGMSKAFRNLNVYLTGTNLLLLSSFKLGDPEVNNFEAGSGFNSVSQGFAGGQYPYAKSFTMGLNVQF